MSTEAQPSCPTVTTLYPDDHGRWLDAGLLLALFGVLAYGIGGYGLFEPHEGHFGGVGREMLERNDWITPHLNGAPYLNKPPLFYWMIATSYSIFGVSEWAARFAQVLVGWMGIVTAWWWARELWGPVAGRIAALILAASAGWYLFSHQLIIDPLLSTIYLTALYLLWRVTKQPTRWQSWFPFYVYVGLIILAKGLIGPVMLALVALGFMVWRKDWTLLKQSHLGLGLLIVGAICVPWVYTMELRNPGFLEYALVNEHAKRYVDTRWPPDYSGVKVSAPLFALVTLIWLTPWSLLLPQVASFGYKKGRSGPLKEGTQATRDAIALLLLGAAVPLFFFLPMPSRLIYYTLPVLPPFAVLTAGWWSGSTNACYDKGRSVGGLIFAGLGLVIFSAGFWVPGLIANIPDLKAVPEVLPFIPRLAFVLGVALVAGGALLFLKRPALGMAALAGLIALAGAYNTAGFAAFDPMRSSKRLVQQLDPKLGPDAVWISEGSKEIGASAGIAYYLTPGSDGKPRRVWVMADDERRPPPSFPDPQPAYLLRKDGLNKLWQADVPTVFITDFQRTDWDADAPRLPGEQCQLIKLGNTGHRRVYVNASAWKRLQQTYDSSGLTK